MFDIISAQNLNQLRDLYTEFWGSSAVSEARFKKKPNKKPKKKLFLYLNETRVSRFLL